MSELDFFFSKNQNSKKEMPKKDGIILRLKRGISMFFPRKAQWYRLPLVLTRREKYVLVSFILLIIGTLIYIPFAFYFGATIQIPDFGGKYREGTIGEPHFINPVLIQTNDVDRDLSALIYAGLLKSKGQGMLVPDLAERYEISENGKVYTFFLRKNAFWHDGIPVSADDIIFTIETIQNPDYSSPQQINWRGVKVEKQDSHTITFTLRNIYAQFPANTTLGILPKHIWNGVSPEEFRDHSANLMPIGAGPYSMESIKKNRAGRITGAVLRANHKYHLQRPFIEKLVFKFYPSEIHLNRALAKKEIDGTSAIAPYRAPQLALQHNKKLETLDLTRFFLIFINTDNQILKEKNVRLALAYATNKQEIVSTVLRGQGIVVDSPILPKFFHFNSDIKRYPFNPQLAQDILEKSGWRNTEKGVREKDGTPLKLSLVTSNLEEFKLVTELLKSQWEDVGFAVTVQMVSLPELQRNHIQERNFDLLLFGEVLTIIPDPFSFWHSSQKHDPGLNIAVYENRKADALLEEARQTIDPIARARMYDDFQQIVIEDLPAIFLYSAHLPYLLPKKIKGVAHMRISLPSERFANIEQWYIKTKRAKKK